MLPESSEAGGVFLYKSNQFPYNWERGSSFYQAHLWTRLFSIITRSGGCSLAAKMEETYICSILTESTGNGLSIRIILFRNNSHISRPAGKVVSHEGDMYRFTQDGVPSYGKLVKAARIIKLNETEYEEEVIEQDQLTGSDQEGSWRKVACIISIISKRRIISGLSQLMDIS